MGTESVADAVVVGGGDVEQQHLAQNYSRAWCEYRAWLLLFVLVTPLYVILVTFLLYMLEGKRWAFAQLVTFVCAVIAWYIVFVMVQLQQPPPRHHSTV